MADNFEWIITGVGAFGLLVGVLLGAGSFEGVIFCLLGVIFICSGMWMVIKDPKNKKALEKAKKLTPLGLAVVIACLVLFVVISRSTCRSTCEKVYNNLAGEVFEDVSYSDTLNLHDSINNKDYRFYGAESTFVFNDDGTVTWTRKYDRAYSGSSVWTEPITTTEKYTVEYLGDLPFNKNDSDKLKSFYIVLESGDILHIGLGCSDPGWEERLQPDSVNYSVLHDEALSAPEELMNMETSRIESKSSNSSSTIGRQTCPLCNGTGSVKYYYGESDLEAILSGYDPYTFGPCTMCDGTGRVN